MPPTATPLPNAPNQFAFSFPSTPHFSHIVVFMIPGNQLPPDTAAGVYLQLPDQEFRFLGAIGNEKQSAIFRVNLPANANANGMQSLRDINVGISVEPLASIQQQLLQLQSEQQHSPRLGSGGSRPSTKILAQRIINNAFNFLAGFSGRVGDGGVEVVPLKSFEEWWRKFERRVEMDPRFLERDES